MSEILEEIKDLMVEIQDYATDTYWISGGETVFERLWLIYVENGGAEDDLFHTFPCYGGPVS